MTDSNILQIIENFYRFFNASELDKLFLLIDDNVIHEFNYVQTKGIEAFIDFIKTSKKFYEERVDDYVVMVSKDGRKATTRFRVKGKYICTDNSSLPANGQSYELDVLNYVEVENNKIVKASCWFNEQDWIRQISN